MFALMFALVFALVFLWCLTTGDWPDVRSGHDPTVGQQMPAFQQDGVKPWSFVHGDIDGQGGVVGGQGTGVGQRGERRQQHSTQYGQGRIVVAMLWVKTNDLKTFHRTVGSGGSNHFTNLNNGKQQTKEKS